MANMKKLLQAAAGTAAAAGGGGGLDVSEVFSTYLYTGNGSTQTITNGIDLAGEGGLVWIKARGEAYDHMLYDTDRGALYDINSNQTAVSALIANSLTSFNSDGFSVGSYSRVNNGGSQKAMASWTFRKAPKFFDVVTWTGNGTAPRTISHNLGSVPGCIIAKRTDSSGEWQIYHRGIDATAPEDYYIHFDTAARTDFSIWGDTAPTDTEFTLGLSNNAINGNGATYVAYLFAHNDGDGDFGPTGDQDIIKCGSYTGQNSTVTIDLGFEPQFVLIKKTNNTADWVMLDTMRGMTHSSDSLIYPNTSGAEEPKTYKHIAPIPNGFEVPYANGKTNGSGSEFIYIAIRRGPMAVPTDATDVFAIDTGGGTAPTPPWYNSGWPVDMELHRRVTSTNDNYLGSRLLGSKGMKTNSNDAEGSFFTNYWDFNNGVYDSTGTNSDFVSWMWRRAPNFFDVVAYTGNGTAGRTVSHNLGVAPEMMWVKKRDTTANWSVYHSGLTGSTLDYRSALRLNTTSAELIDETYWSNYPDADSFYLDVNGGDGNVNQSGGTYIAYLFASLDGVSKVGSYTGNAQEQTIDCGFTNGARFVLIKRSDSSGDWTVFDTERGYNTATDYWLDLNNSVAESSGNTMTARSSGFGVRASSYDDADININGATYIFYAIA